MDDKSEFVFLGDQLDEYVKTLPIDVQVIRMKERNGIVMARLRGAEYAQVVQPKYDRRILHTSDLNLISL